MSRTPSADMGASWHSYPTWWPKKVVAWWTVEHDAARLTRIRPLPLYCTKGARDGALSFKIRQRTTQIKTHRKRSIRASL